MYIQYFLWLLGSYLVGSFLFGVFWAKVFGLGNLRSTGSGNVGATNVMRSGGKKGKIAALFTLICDAGKGALMVAIAYKFSDNLSPLFAGLGAVLGHNFPIFSKFKGGKGVATTLGVHLALFPPLGFSTLGVWLFTAVVWRYSSLAALVSLSFVPIAGIFFADTIAKEFYQTTFISWFVVALFLAILAFIRHRANVLRLIQGQETKI